VGGHGLTKSGKTPVAGVTVAADPSVYPIGTQLDIEGLGVRTVQDIGGDIKGHKIDVFMPTHEEAKKFGWRNLRVRRLSNKE
jgi:3D (Asp-Asp-Asp) domain-containing protein